MSYPVVCIGDLIDEEMNGISFKTEDFSDFGTLVIPKKGISPNITIDRQNLLYVPLEIADQYKKNLIDDSYLITTLRDLVPSAPNLGRVCKIQTTDGFLLAQGVYAFKIKRADNRYLAHYSNSLGFREQVLRFKVGSTQVHIRSGDFKSIEIPLPPLAEQKRIAAILDKADAIRRKRQQAIQLADDFLRSVFLDMFGDPVTNPKGWEVRNLDSCLDFLTSGSRGWAQYYSEQGDKFIRIQNVGKNKLLLADMAYINAPSGAEAIRTKIKKGDVLLSITADLGSASVVTEDISGGFINQHLAILRVNQNQINPRYLAAFLSSDAGVRQFTSKNKSAVKAGLNFSDIKSLAIALPPLNLQKKYEYIYEKLEQLHINNFKDAHQSNSLFNSLSQKAFSGQL